MKTALDKRIAVDCFRDQKGRRDPKIDGYAKRLDLMLGIGGSCLIAGPPRRIKREDGALG